MITDIELNKKLFKNIDEDSLTSTFSGLENCFVTEANGISRFPGLVEFADFGSTAEIYIGRYKNDMIASGTDGRTYRVNSNGTYTEVEGSKVLGGDRTSFSRTRDGLLMTSGGKIIKYNGKKNSILSDDAPLSSFVGYIDGYVLAVEKNSGRFQHSTLNENGTWNALDTFAVDGAPDNINAMLINPFNEIMFTGEESIEQYERYVGGAVPFFRRWSVGEGISEPWTVCFADNATWGLNSRYEFVRISGQTSRSVSDDIQKDIEDRYSMNNLGNLDKAWAAPITIKGQKFILFQSPEATNKYGTRGFTSVYDIKRGQWFDIFGWDDKIGQPDLWPGRSIFSIWGKTFVGGNGKIYELSSTAYNNDGKTQRAYIKTGHYDSPTPIRIDMVRMIIKRGVGSYTENPQIMLRTNPDNKGFGNIQYRNLGYTGQGDMVIEFGSQGIGETWQFEITMTDNCPFELRRLQIEQSRLPR